MDNRAYAANASATPPAAPTAPSIGYPKSGNPSTSDPATWPGPYWVYALGEEMRNVIVAAGLAPDINDLTQMRQAIGLLPGGVLNRDVTLQEVVNTVVETTVYSFVIPANTLGANKMLRLSLNRDVLNNFDTISSLFVRVKLGATTIAISTNMGSGTIDPDPYGVVIKTEISAVNTNAQRSKTEFTHNISSIIGVSGGIATSDSRNTAYHYAVAENSETDLTLVVTVQHGVANANISFRCHTAQLELL